MDYDAALADNARARVRVRGPTAAALRTAAAAVKATASGTAATGATAGGGREPLEQLRGAHVVAASLLALQRALAGIMDALVTEFGVEPSAKAEARRLWGLAIAAARVFGDENDGEDGNSGSVAEIAEARAETWRDAPEQGAGSKSSPDAVASLAFSAGQELGRRGLGPRCMLSLALLASWRSYACASGSGSRSRPPVTPLDLVRGAACGLIPFLDLSPFAAAASTAAAAAAAAAATANGDDNPADSSSSLSLPPRLTSLPLVSTRLLRPRSLPGADRVAARAARLGRALLATNDDDASLQPLATLLPSPSDSPPLLPPLPNPAALAARWLSEMGAPSQLAAVAAELYRLLASSALSTVAAASGRKKTPGSKKKKRKRSRKKMADESSSESSGSESERSSNSEDEEDGGGAKRQQQRPPSSTSHILPALTDDSRLDPVRALAASLVLSLKLCYGLGGPADRIDMRGFGQRLPGLPAAPRAERGGDDGSGSDGDGDESSAAVARGWHRWASAVVEASGRPPVPVCVPELGEDSDRYVLRVSRGVFCGGTGGGGELEAALSSRARAAAVAAAAAAEEAERSRVREEQQPAVPAPLSSPARPPPCSRRRKRNDETRDCWKPGFPWLCARWQPVGAVEAAAAAAAAAAYPAAAAAAALAVSSSSSRPSDFALPPAYAAVLAAVSAHCGYVPRALHETAVALEDELSRKKKR